MAAETSELFLLEAWVADNPGSKLFVRLARAYREAGRLDDAVAVLEQGLVLNPAMVEARRLLAALYQDQGRIERAEEELTLAARELTRHAGLFEDLARLWDGQGLGEAAAQARELAEALDLGLGEPVSVQETEPEQPRTTPRSSPSAQVPALSTPPGLARLQALERAARKRARD